MTLLQTRVEENEAKRFAGVARERGLTTYALLKSLVQNEIARGNPGQPWESHAERLEAMNKGQSPVPFNAVSKDREGER